MMRCKKCAGEMEQVDPDVISIAFGVRNSFGCGCCGAVAIVFAVAGEPDLVVFTHEIPKGMGIEEYVDEQIRRRKMQ